MAEDSVPELATLIWSAIQTQLVDVHTAIPGRVESYDVTRQVANVKPMLRRVLRSEEMDRITEELPVIPCVPVAWLKGGGAFVTLPLAVGDTGLLIFAEHLIDRWRATGEDVDPGDLRRHDLSGAVFYPGLSTAANQIQNSSATEMRFGLDASYVAGVDASGARFPHDATQFLARADRTLSELQSIASALISHVHSGVTTGPGLTGPSNSTYAAASPACDTLKAK